jgi:hypothetical protein
MAFADPDFQKFKSELAKLMTADVLGFYTHFEVTEIFAYKDREPPLNVFSILVAEERLPRSDGTPKFLGDRIQLKSLKGWTFGIKRSLKLRTEIEQAFDHYHAAGEWKPSGDRLLVGELVPVPTQFVPPDSTATVPWNHVLKNNFWSGSYVIECADIKKTSLQPFLDDPRRLQELSTEIQKHVPIRLASLSDRLGNVVVQLPVTVLVSQFGRNRVTGDSTVGLQWHPQATSRALRASCEMQFDNMISGYASSDIRAPQTAIPMANGDGMQRGIVWDDQHQVILAATASTGFIETIGFNLRASDPEPRTFTLKDDKGQEVPVRVGLSTGSKSLVRAPTVDRGTGWARRRIYRDEAARLAAAGSFVQYKPKAGQQSAEHEKALGDIRRLLNAHGEDGAWMWDPYLSAEDILKTLFYCSHANADLRALTSGHEIPAAKSATSGSRLFGKGICEWVRQALGGRPSPPRAPFAETQRRVIEDAKSNLRGLRLEYRIKIGPAGWAFHDRFLIFPKKDSGALAWSLGTSVNSLGKQHHILQQVDDGQLVMEAFSELWEELILPEHQVWKTP